MKEKKGQMMTGQESNNANGFVKTILAAGGLVGGWLLYSSVGINHQVSMPPAIKAERKEFHGANSTFLSYYADTSAAGVPLVLIHSINAASNAYEVRPIFEAYRETRPVYALDLPGFGFSERSDREYSIKLYVNAIADFLDEIGADAVDLVGISLSSEFIARFALQQPERIRSLVLISPSGFSARNRPGSQSAQANDMSAGVHKFLSNPIWSQGLYDLLVTKPIIRYFLNMNFEGEVDPGLLNYAYITTHQPGARHAPLYFVSGHLFSPDIYQTVYLQIQTPALVLYDRDPNVSFELLPSLLERRLNWRARKIPKTLGLPHFERMEKVKEALDEFWAEL